ncbi:uncharacterized protein LOC136084398 [Hydra vulgaris]|uniref:Uncharacterized protein LOC136084398 n=1 Tax=Hydra vulgaris TaxID=6087 RepID=A0ABM4CFJ8_HYDVU
MKLVILVCLIPILLAENEIENTEQVCYGEWLLLRKKACFEARDEHPAFVPINIKGWLSEIKLVNVSGVLKCWQQATGSKFGCYSDANSLSMYITDNKRKMIFPTANQQLIYDAKTYKLPGVSANDNEMKFSKLDYPVPYRREEQFIEIWNGEDLFNYTEENNSGKVCADVYGIFL